jgi:hypothetical protein
VLSYNSTVECLEASGLVVEFMDGPPYPRLVAAYKETGQMVCVEVVNGDLESAVRELAEKVGVR